MDVLDLHIRLARGPFTLTVDQPLPLQGLTAVIGPSGAGKSTLLRVIAGFERGNGRIAFGSEVWEDGPRFVPPHLRRVGFVFQRPELFPHLTVAQNLAYAARRAGGNDQSAQVIRDYGLDPLLDRRTPTLSGGEAQRVALARALLSRPRLLVMDEPLSALDPARKSEILPHIERLRDRDGLPILYVSHSLAEVARLADNVLALAEGRAVALGPVAQVFADPASAAAFGGEEPGSLITVRVARQEPDGLARLEGAGGTLFAPLPQAHPGQSLRLMIRSRDVMIATTRPEGISALNILPARVARIGATHGASTEIFLDCGGQNLRALVTNRSVGALNLGAGTDCHAILKSVVLAQD